MKKWGMYLLISALLVVGAIGALYFFQQQKRTAFIASFEECVNAGFPVMESYPPRCQVPGGMSFTQYIGNELEFIDEITISHPRPNQAIDSPLTVSGQARGMWFFEGSFSAELFDGNKNSLGTIVLQANGEWMTEEFVPFEGELVFVRPETPTGELVIKNANPSGLPENQKTLTLPVKF